MPKPAQRCTSRRCHYYAKYTLELATRPRILILSHVELPTFNLQNKSKIVHCNDWKFVQAATLYRIISS